MQSFLGRSLLGGFLSLGIAFTDLFIERVIPNSFSIGQQLEIIPGFFAVTFIRNPGVAFGLLSGWHSPLRLALIVAFSIVAVVFIFNLYFGPLGTRKLSAVGLLLIAGGAIANFYERLTVGAVVDYLDFYVYGYHWPAFNVADASITLGVALLLLDSLWDRSEGTRSL